MRKRGKERAREEKSERKGSPLMKTNAVKMSANVRGFAYDFYRLETSMKNDGSKCTRLGAHIHPYYTVTTFPLL